jgi:hypothetical protein
MLIEASEGGGVAILMDGESRKSSTVLLSVLRYELGRLLLQMEKWKRLSTFSRRGGP